MRRLPILLLLPACVNYVGNGVSATEERDLRPVVELVAAGPVDVVVHPGEPPAMSVTCDENLLPYVQTVVESGTLTVRSEPGVAISPRTACFVDITLDGLRIVGNAASGDVSIDAGDDIETARVSGSGDLEVQGIDGAAVSLADSGSGGLLATGTASHVDAEVSGSGTLDAMGLVAATVDARNSGSGDLIAYATDSATLSLTGSGDIELWGGADEVTEDDDGSGSIVVR